MARPLVEVRPVDGRAAPRRPAEAVAGQGVPEVLVEGGDAVVVEARGDRAEDRELLEGDAGDARRPGQLAADVAQGVLAAPPLELVDRDRVGEVEHVDLLELGRRPRTRASSRTARRRRAATTAASPWPMPGRLHDHQVEPGGPAGGDGVVEAGGQLAPEPRVAKDRKNTRPRGPAPRPCHPPPALAAGHLAVDGVHPDAVAEQGPAALAPGRVDGQDGDAQLVLLVEAEAADQLVGQRRLARAAGAGDAEDRGRCRAAACAIRIAGRRRRPSIRSRRR